MYYSKTWRSSSMCITIVSSSRDEPVVRGSYPIQTLLAKRRLAGIDNAFPMPFPKHMRADPLCSSADNAADAPFPSCRYSHHTRGLIMNKHPGERHGCLIAGIVCAEPGKLFRSTALPNLAGPQYRETASTSTKRLPMLWRQSWALPRLGAVDIYRLPMWTWM